MEEDRVAPEAADKEDSSPASEAANSLEAEERPQSSKRGDGQRSWGLGNISNVESWTKFSIYIFSALSFLTTMSGMRVFFPTENVGTLGIIGSVLASLAVQALMLSFAFRIKQEGVKGSLVLMYSIAAIVSMSFSYIGLFKSYSGGFINEEDRGRFDVEFREYSKRLGSCLSIARNEVKLAVRIAEQAVTSESTRGRATVYDSPSKYFNSLLDESGLDLTNRSSRPGEGPVYNWLKATHSALKGQSEQLDSLHELHLELSKSGIFFKGDKDSKVQAAYAFETTADWPLIERVIIARELPFQRPELPNLVQQVGGGAGSGISRENEIKWSVHAFQALRARWNQAVVAIPVIVAVILDLVILLIAILFRDSARLKPDQLAVEKSIARVLDTIALAESELSSGLHAILHFADSRGSGGRKSWALDADRVERMSPAGKLILLQLARSRLAREPWHSERLVLSNVVYLYLSKRYSDIRGSGALAGA